MYFGLCLEGAGMEIPEHAADTIRCVHCQHELTYRRVYLSHLGDYECGRCGRKRPPLDIAVTGVEASPDGGSEVTAETPAGTVQVYVPLPGMHNVYNAVAAIAGAYALGILEPESARRALAQVSPAFGRLEEINADGRQAVLSFVKNPTSYNATLRLILQRPGRKYVLAAHSNTVVDGEDFAWLWDVDLERLVPDLASLVVSGTRAEEVALRMKYAGVGRDDIRVIPGRRSALDTALARTPPDDSLYILAATPRCGSSAGSCNDAAGCRHFGRSDMDYTAPISIRICHLYPRLLSVAGDRGNLLALTRRCDWRGIECHIAEAEVGDVPDFTEFDLILMHGGQDCEMRVAERDLAMKAGSLREAIEADTVVLAVCAGYQLLGKYYAPIGEPAIAGIGALDAVTEGGSTRFMGHIAVACDLGQGGQHRFVGFENHSGRTYLGPGVNPLGRVIAGSGNNGQDGGEGARP